MMYILVYVPPSHVALTLSMGQLLIGGEIGMGNIELVV